MRVLLMSPVAGHDVPGGDVAYTEALLARPPTGVTYTSYVDALAEGSLVERGRRPRHGSISGTDVVVLGARAVELGLRTSGLMFRESYRYLTVDPDAFDLVHAHLFAIRLIASDLPLVTSSGFPLSVLYEDRFHWTNRRVVVAAAADRIMSRVVGAELPWLPPRRASRTMVQSAHYRDRLIEGGARPDRVAVRTLGIEGQGTTPRKRRPTTVGFVTTTFEQKGGSVVLEAFRQLLAQRPDARLVIVGSERGSLPDGLPAESVTWMGTVPRRRLLEEILPAVDVVVLPTRCDSGPPFAILEALQRGIPVVTSDLVWIDEELAGPGVRRVPVAPTLVAAALIDLLDEDTYPRAAAAAVALWRARYTMDVVAEQVGATYRAALAAGPS
jgi:glycosyltransferase involved in cell wall biosynthesis